MFFLIFFKNELSFYCQISSNLPLCASVSLDLTLKLFLSRVFSSGVAYYKGPHLNEILLLIAYLHEKGACLDVSKEGKRAGSAEPKLQSVNCRRCFWILPSFICKGKCNDKILLKSSDDLGLTLAFFMDGFFVPLFPGVL